MLRSTLALSLLIPSASAPSVSSTCSAPVAVPASVTTPNATYYTDALPPKRFSRAPHSSLKLIFGQDRINAFCGKPPCGYVFEGCTDGSTMALPDPFTTDPQTFMRLLRHELAHVNGWPDTHGD